jgi:hypothetical protein
MGNTGIILRRGQHRDHTSPWATLLVYDSTRQTFSFLFFSSLLFHSFSLLLSITILSLASNLVTLRLLLTRVCSISARP